MIILNIITVVLSNIISRLSVWKNDPSAPAVAIGYGYAITDAQE